jgi:FkbM family methyltransferase
VKALLKRLRYAQPANRIVTAALRGLFRLLGRPVPEPIVAHLHRVGEIGLRAEGIGEITVYSRADDFTPNQAWWRGLESAEPDALLFARLARDAATVIDVGAYIGVYSLLAARANPAARVIAFEPFPRSRERLLRNIELSAVGNVEVRPAAAGAEAGEATFHHAETAGLPSSAGLSPLLLEDGAGGLAELTVPVETIDGLLAAREIETLDLLKLDTEGTEPEVLSGALGAIERFRPAIICEILRRTGVAGPVEEILTPFGYRFFHLAAGGPVPMTRIEPEPGAAMALNYLMLPEPRQPSGPVP